MRLEAVDVGFRHARAEWLFRNRSIAVTRGEIVGLAGRSGIGKTTLAKLLAGYLKPVEGEVRVDGDIRIDGEVRVNGPSRRAKLEPDPVQLVFQHPEQSVNPRWTIERILREGWEVEPDLLSVFGIEQEWLNRLPSELSGGELQRVCIVRALGPGTRYLIADEMTTMLDPITQAQIWQSMLDIAKARNLGLLVISHDHALLARICDRIIEWNGSGQRSDDILE